MKKTRKPWSVSYYAVPFYPALWHLSDRLLFHFRGDRLGAISKRVLPFLVILIVDLLLTTFYPPLTMWMARLVAG